MEKALSYLVALLGAWLIVAISVFPAGTALWIAFGTAIGITSIASAAAATGFVKGRRLTPTASTAVAGLGAFLIVASLVFEGASLGWLQAIAGGVIELVALGALALPSLKQPVALAPATPERRVA